MIELHDTRTRTTPAAPHTPAGKWLSDGDKGSLGASPVKTQPMEINGARLFRDSERGRTGAIPREPEETEDSVRAPPSHRIDGRGISRLTLTLTLTWLSCPVPDPDDLDPHPSKNSVCLSVC
jgi:hypothetical protein